MKKEFLALLLIIFSFQSAKAAFWNKQNNTQPTQTQASPSTDVSSQNQSETTYPDDVEDFTPAGGGNIDNIDVEEKYREMPVPEFKYIHDIDPGEYLDTMHSTWSPYPLFRLTAPLYFKTISIQPGYYLLTPREHDDKWYILFKEAGRIKYIIPCYKREMVPMDFYKNNLPQVKMTAVQLIREKTLKFIGEHIKSSKREPAPDTYLEAEDLDDSFISIIVYWGNYRYYMVLRSIQL